MYLLDTNVLIWWLEGNTRLSLGTRRLLEGQEARVFVSAVSVWEISIKSSLGKLKIPKSFFEELKNSQFDELPISFAHAKMVRDLPPIHNDPFDRLLVAQAQDESLTIITRDRLIPKYKILCLTA